MKKENGTGQRPAPRRQLKYSKTINICLIIFAISVIMLILGKTWNNDKVEFFAIGMMMVAGIIDVALMEEGR